jgi:hypothetical protein
MNDICRKPVVSSKYPVGIFPPEVRCFPTEKLQILTKNSMVKIDGKTTNFHIEFPMAVKLVKMLIFHIHPKSTVFK